ncbi:hypothetical protein IFM89_037503 [Coptis chinensis]|uniref:Uncharacterized protein n=1 Tax=Coptis chinensis TaxID=261450 RepID=A0A835IS35_9MAGN|nr:hypothetical protein IFM89_037503 [Coptis chinensis]
MVQEIKNQDIGFGSLALEEEPAPLPKGIRHYFYPTLHTSIPLSIIADFQKSYRGPKPKKEWIVDWVTKNDDIVRSLPIYVGGFSLLAVLFNRTISGIAPIADASSSQSRADLLTLGQVVTNVLTRLVWLSIQPKSISVVIICVGCTVSFF